MVMSHVKPKRGADLPEALELADFASTQSRAFVEKIFSFQSEIWKRLDDLPNPAHIGAHHAFTARAVTVSISRLAASQCLACLGFGNQIGSAGARKPYKLQNSSGSLVGKWCKECLNTQGNWSWRSSSSLEKKLGLQSGELRFCLGMKKRDMEYYFPCGYIGKYKYIHTPSARRTIKRLQHIVTLLGLHPIMLQAMRQMLGEQAVSRSECQAEVPEWFRCKTAADDLADPRLIAYLRTMHYTFSNIPTTPQEIFDAFSSALSLDGYRNNRKRPAQPWHSSKTPH